MAIGWLAVLKGVPWSDVIRNAPLVADGAKKLWGSVGGRSATSEPVPLATMAGAASEADTLAALATKFDRLESDHRELHELMRSSSELIKALAEQNAQLVQRIELHRQRVLWLAATTLLTTALAVGAWFMLLVPAAA